MRTVLALVLLFALYQAPQGINDYLLPDRRVWLALTFAFFPVASLVARYLGGSGLSDYGLTRPAWPNLPVGLAVGFAASAGAGLLAWSLGLYRIDHITPLSSFVGPAALFAVASALASLAEDILTRGFLWRFTTLGQTGSRPYVAISAAAFLVNHIYVVRRGPAMWVFLVALGFGLAWALRRTGSLWLTFGAHWGWNLAYHWSNLALDTTTTGAIPSANTWVSALSAGMLAAILVALSPRLSRQSSLSGLNRQLWNKHESTSSKPPRKPFRRSSGSISI